ncbi:1816_t:CDS:1, partial [Ambispora leptoticha]
KYDDESQFDESDLNKVIGKHMRESSEVDESLHPRKRLEYYFTN